jgi:tRNA threonylcarbamoyladenosine biosynthesis protein TsaB
MPRALALETSGRQGSVALSENGQVLAEDTFSHGLQHAATLLPKIDQLCRQFGWTPQSIEHIYVSIGPGSFTGLRVGVTLAKTLALATGAKIVAVPTLAVLRGNAPDEAKCVILVLDAKRGQIFTARYTKSSCTSEGLAASVTTNPAATWIEAEPAHLDTLANMLVRSERPVHLVGEGIPYHRDAIPTNDSGVIVTDESCWQARASVVARLGEQMAAGGEWADPFTLVPLYVRLPEPEEKRLAELAKGTSA